MLKIAIQTQDETLIAHQLAKFDLSELTNLVQTDRVRALAHIDAMLLQGDDSVFDKLIEWANERELSPSKFPRDKDALKALKELNLSDCGLKTLPQELVCLQGLEELNVSKNKFQGVVPRVICELKNLKTLILGGCGLNDLPDEFAKLQGLERLELWRNTFQKAPKALCELKNLKELILNKCGVSSLPDEFANLQGLESLTLENNGLYEFPKVLCQLTSLKKLDLLRCGLETLPYEIVNLQGLEELVLGYNNFKKFPNALCGLINLKSLNLAKCGLKTLPDTLEVLQKLEKLYLPLNQLVCDKWLDSRDLPQVIFKLRNLQELDLCDCNIPSCSTLPKEFINLQNLKKLFINSADFWSDSSVVVSSSQFPSDTTVLSNLKIQVENRGEQLEIHTSTKFKFFWWDFI